MRPRLGRYRDILRLRLRSIFRRDLVERELKRELRAHLEQQIAEYIEAGMSALDARRAALREFGPLGSIEERCRDTRRVAFVHHLHRDVRYAWRSLLRQPMLVLVATTSIALGAGANLSIFSLASGLLLSVPSAVRPDRLVHIRTGDGSHVSYQTWRALNESGVLAGIAGHNIEAIVNWRGDHGSTTIVPLVVTANFFDVVGMPLAQGRAFSAREADAARDPRLLVLSHRFWEQQLSADPAVVGRSLMLNGEPYVVTGVLAAGVRSFPGFGISPDAYVPISRALMTDLDRPGTAAVQLVGRLRDGQTLEAGRAAVSAVAARLAESPGGRGSRAIHTFAPVGGLSQVGELRGVGAFFLVLLGVAGLVLAVACANVAGLLLARSTTRRREIAVRAALGASRSRLVQQLLTEGFVLALVGTAGGLALTVVLGGLLSRLSLPLPVPVEVRLPVDERLTAVAFGLVMLTTVLCSVAPALQATRSSAVPALKEHEQRYGHRRMTMRGLLVVGQVAVTVLLLAAAAVFLRSLAIVHTLSPGFDSAHALVAQITFVEGRQGTPAAPAVERLVDEIRALPGVEAAAFTDGVPLTMFAGSRTGTALRIGAAAPIHAEYDANRVGPGYFAAMGIALLHGRDFVSADRPGAPPVAIVNKTFVDRYLGGGDPIGTRFVGADGDRRAVEIVGVVANGKYRTLAEDADAAMYTPYLQKRATRRMVHVIVRTAGAPGAIEAVVRDTIRRHDDSAAASVQPLSSALGFAFFPSQAGAALFGAMGALATLLAVSGLYGVVSFGVARRTQEIGIRIALGASRSDVLRLVMRDCLMLAGPGLAAGVALACLVTGRLGDFLVAGLSPTDPLSVTAAALVIALVSLLATWIPARRAMHIQPAVAVRHD